MLVTAISLMVIGSPACTVQAFYHRKRCLTAVAMGTDGISVSVAPVAHGGRERARPGRRFT
jgi:hypothetical protein